MDVFKRSTVCGACGVDMLHKLRSRVVGRPFVGISRRQERLLGRCLVDECQFRQYIDQVFCLAPFEAEIERLNAILGDTGLYAREPGKFADVTKALDAAQAALAAAEEQWLALEMLREELEGA